MKESCHKTFSLTHHSFLVVQVSQTLLCHSACSSVKSELSSFLPILYKSIPAKDMIGIGDYIMY